MALPGKSSTVLKKIVNILVNITCEGKYVSSLYGCVSDGEVCSNHGSCEEHKCACERGYEGTYCESIASDSSSSDSGVVIGIVIGTTIESSPLLSLMNLSEKCLFFGPGVTIPVLLIILIVVIIVVVVITVRKRKKDEAWEIGITYK